MYSRRSYGAQFSLALLSSMLWITIIIITLYTPYWLPKSNKKTLYVATWADLIDPALLELFYKKHGISVVLNYFEDNYELVQKVIATQGNEYDLIIPSDFALEQLINKGLIKPLKKQYFDHWYRLNPATLSIYADPDNHYSIPYHWAIYGLGVNRKVIDEPYDWSLIFEKQSKYKVTMIGSARETILMALYYYYGSIVTPSLAHLECLKDNLLKQKAWVEAYTEFRTDTLLLSGTIGSGVITTPAFLRLSYNAPDIVFVVPKQGTFQMIDSWAIPQHSVHEQEIYLFLNFLYETSTIVHHFNKYTFFPATKELYTLLDQTAQGRKMSTIHQQSSIPLNFFKNTVQQSLLNDIWIEIKGSN